MLGCSEGRKCSKDKWIDYNFYGHQLVCHYTHENFIPQDYCNPVDGDSVPVPHFGLCLNVKQWHETRDLLMKVNTKFIIEPHLRFEGEPG